MSDLYRSNQDEGAGGVGMRLGCLLGIGVVSIALAQNTPSDDRAIEQTRRTLEAGPSEPRVLLPEGPFPEGETSDARAPAIGPESVLALRGQLVREGAFLRDRQGRLVEVEGIWVYVFDPDVQGRAEPPMVLQPSIRLKEMADLVASREVSPTFLVSGTVFVYHGRNYLLPSNFTFLSADEPVGRSLDDAEAVDHPEASRELDPAVEELLEQMRAGQGARRSDGAEETATSGDREQALEEGLLREGQMLVHRVGRVVSGGGGYWMFAPDNGALGQSDRPLRLLPCRNLMGIERVLNDHGGSVKFSLSGQVLSYGKQNYLIPTVYRIEQDREGNTVAAH